MHKKLFLIPSLVAATLVSSEAALIAGWNRHTTGSTSYPLSAASLDSTAVASATMSHEGLEVSTDTRTVFTGRNPRAVIDLNTDYLQFTVGINPGYTAELHKLRLTAATIANLDLDVRSSADNYATSLGVIDLTGDYVNYDIDLSSLGEVDGSITFRLYGFNSTSAAWNGFYGVPAGTYPGYLATDGAPTTFFAVFGTAVPESSTMLLGAVGAFGLLRRRR